MLVERLGLALRGEGEEPFPGTRGVVFVGWRTWWDRRVPRRRTIGNVTTRLDRFARRHLRPGPVRDTREIVLGGAGAGEAVDGVRRSLASSSGHLRHGGAWRVWVAVWARYAWLDALFARDGWTLVSRWPARPLVEPTGRFGTQYRGLVGRAGEGVLVFCPVGRYVEFYGPQRLLAERALGLRPVYLPRAGYGFTVGFPRGLASAYLQRAIAAGLAVVLVGTGARVMVNGPRRRLAGAIGDGRRRCGRRRAPEHDPPWVVSWCLPRSAPSRPGHSITG